MARKVAARLKPDSLSEFTNLMEHEVLPWLRKQKGFLDLIILAVPHCREVATISFWDEKGNGHFCNSDGYAKALKMLDRLLDGAPYVKTFEVVGSTFPGLRAEPPQAQNLARETGLAELGFTG